MSWLQGEPADRDAVLGLRPELAAAHATLLAQVRAAPVPDRILELCRVRAAQLLDARAALAEPTTLEAETVAALPRWRQSPGFDDAAERACLTFAELFVVDHHAITDEQAAAVRDELGEPGLVALTTALAVWENQHRLDIALGVTSA